MGSSNEPSSKPDNAHVRRETTGYGAQSFTRIQAISHLLWDRTRCDTMLGERSLAAGEHSAYACYNLLLLSFVSHYSSWNTLCESSTLLGNFVIVLWWPLQYGNLFPYPTTISIVVLAEAISHCCPANFHLQYYDIQRRRSTDTSRKWLELWNCG